MIATVNINNTFLSHTIPLCDLKLKWIQLLLKNYVALFAAMCTLPFTELPKLGRHYEKEALVQFLPWNLTEKIAPLKQAA
jgi:hypothetical protein